jgi:hypothetical protein
VREAMQIKGLFQDPYILYSSFFLSPFIDYIVFKKKEREREHKSFAVAALSLL